MMRSEFAHAIRAAGAVLGVAELLVIGSQAIHGSVAEDVPLEAVRSIDGGASIWVVGATCSL